MTPEERARRIKWGIPDDPAKRAPTPAQRAAIDRLTGNPPGGSAPRAGRPEAAPPGRPRATPPPDRLHPPAAPVRDQRAETAGHKARHAADPSTVADHTRPRTDDRRPDASDHPVADRPATDRPVANRPGTEGPAGDRPENAGAADAPSGHDTRDHTADLDATQAQIADLKKQLADRDGKLDAAQARIADLEARLADRETPPEAAGTWSGDREPPVANRDARPDAETPRLDEQDAAPDAANAEITELRGQLDAANATIAEQRGELDEAKTTIAAQATEIGALNEKTTAHDRAIGDLLGRLQRMENAGADGPARDAAARGAPQPEALAAPDTVGDIPADAPDVSDVVERNPAEELIADRGNRQELKDNPKLSILHRGPSGDALGFLEKAIFGGVGAGSYMMAQDLSHISGWVGYGAGLCVAGLVWLRNRRSKGKG